MPNICDFDMLVEGKKKDVDTFIKWLEADYHYFLDDNGVPKLECSSDYHFYRVFDVYYDKSNAKDDEVIRQVISGDCAWSVTVCMLRNCGSLYYKRTDDDEFKDIRKDIDLVESSWLLNLKIEVYSKEPGMCFAEHYLIDNGKMIIDDCTEYQEICLVEYETKEQAEEDLNTTITEEEWSKRFENEGWVSRCDWDFKFTI